MSRQLICESSHKDDLSRFPNELFTHSLSRPETRQSEQAGEMYPAGSLGSGMDCLDNRGDHLDN